MIYVAIVIGAGLLVMGWEIVSMIIELRTKTNTIYDHVLEVFCELPTLKTELEGLRQELEAIKVQTKSGMSVPAALTEIRNEIYETYKKVDDSRKAITEDLVVLHGAVQEIKGSS